ncbi:MAG: hypothetical protein LWX83_15445, partial [Anaerolineae bacterium]|nr:hypothetical protein [Anaerolineae bacterium]
MKKPSSAEKTWIIFQVLLVLGIIYAAVFFFANQTGAQTPDMLQVFQVDEYAQYPHVIRMLTPGDTFYQTVRNFIIYLHYFYGYIFYFVSALVLLPLRLLGGSQWAENTPLVVALLREGVNVLPAVAALLLLTYMQTGFRSWLRSIGLFLLLLSVPAVTANNLWWHPDSLGLLLVVMVFFFLDRDRQRYGRFFLLAAAACGAAVGTKYLGVFFGLTVPLYIYFGIQNKKITWRKALGMAAAFVAVMAAAVVVTNPLLLLPQERAALIQYQFLQYQQTMSGIILQNTQPFLENGQYPADFQENYGTLLFVLMAFLAAGIGIWRKPTRQRTLLMLVFILPMAYTIFNAATRRIHYWLPVMLPLFSCFIYLFPDAQNKKKTIKNKKDLPFWKVKFYQYAPWLAFAVLFTQFCIFLQSDYKTYNEALNRENTSTSLGFTRQVNELISSLPEQDKKYVAYRDWHIYFPDNQRWRVEMNWDLIDEPYILSVNPDLILLEDENIKLYGDPQNINNAVNPEDFKQAALFYQAANKNQLKGYRLIYRSSFGIALIRETF